MLLPLFLNLQPSAQVSNLIGTLSGTISQTVFNTEKLIASAFRRCRLPSGKITGEMLTLAQQQLYLYLSELSNASIPLWCIDKQVLPLYQGTDQVLCPLGTIDCLNLNLRSLQFLTGTPSATSGIAVNAFDQNLSTACSQTMPGGSITLTFPSVGTPVTTVGILPNTTGVWSYTVQVTADGIVWNTIYEATAQDVINGVWNWIDFEFLTNSQTSLYLNNILAVRLLASPNTVLNVAEFAIANMPEEITMQPINRDEYMSLPNKIFQGRPVQFWFDKQVSQPILHIWPAADIPSQFPQLVMTRHRHIMDVGVLTQLIEVPQRWYNAIIDKLAAAVAIETLEVDPKLVPLLVQRGNESEVKAWGRESDRSSSRLSPDISVYTA